MLILGIDPGSRETHCALFNGSECIHAAKWYGIGHSHGDKGSEIIIGNKWWYSSEITAAVIEWVDTSSGTYGRHPVRSRTRAVLETHEEGLCIRNGLAECGVDVYTPTRREIHSLIPARKTWSPRTPDGSLPTRDQLVTLYLELRHLLISAWVPVEKEGVIIWRLTVKEPSYLRGVDCRDALMAACRDPRFLQDRKYTPRLPECLTKPRRES